MTPSWDSGPAAESGTLAARSAFPAPLESDPLVLAPLRSATLGVFEFLAYTGLWPAFVAAGLVAASGFTMLRAGSANLLAAPIALAMAGTLVVYNIDRLRDLDEDRRSAPARSAFVKRHREALLALTVASAGACLPLTAMLPAAAWGMCALALGLGLFHRRLKKKHPAFAVVYVTLAWLAVVVGIPAVTLAPGLEGLRAAAGAASAVAPAVAANLLASELRGQPMNPATRRRLRGAAAIALVGCLGPLIDAGSRPLIALPLSVWASLMACREGERYGLFVLDGALVVGAGVATGLLAAARG